MFELVIILSRYLFVVYILYFLWQTGLCMFGEESIGTAAWNLAVSKQRITIIFFHLTAFLILSYIETQFLFHTTKLITGAGGLAFLLYAIFFSKRIYQQSCPLLWNCMFFLIDLGFVMLMRLNVFLSQKQLIWAFAGFTAILLIPLFLRLLPPLEKFKILFASVVGILLLLPLLWGESAYGAKSWMQFRSINIQPSEIAKIFFISYLACVFRKKTPLKKLVIHGMTSAVFFCILILQKDLGAALIFFLTFMFMFYIATGNTVLFVSGIGCAALASFFLYALFDHVKLRVAIWLNPFQSPTNEGYQILQSFFAMGTWGMLGSGLTRGFPQSIPIVTKDFIFAAVCEEFGSIFALGVIVIFMMIIFRGFIISMACKNSFYSLMAAGIATLFAVQTFLIIGGVIKFIPMTGVTLPFVCYGGTSMCASIVMLGLLQWIYCANGGAYE